MSAEEGFLVASDNAQSLPLPGQASESLSVAQELFKGVGTQLFSEALWSPLQSHAAHRRKSHAHDHSKPREMYKQIACVLASK